jgi:integrase
MPRSKYTKGKDGLFRTAVRTGQYDDSGKPISIRLSSSKSSADLERKVREIKYEIERGHVYISQATTLKEYALTWLETKKSRSVSTYQGYEYFVNNHLKPLEDMRLDYIRPSDIQRLVNNNAEHPRMCEMILLTLRQIFDMAINDDMIVKNPCNKVELPRHVKNEKRVLTKEERKIVKNADNLDERYRALMHLLYGSGLRPAEVYALTWQDIDFKNNTVSVNKALQFGRTGKTSIGLPKTNKSIRTIPLPDFVIASLVAYKSTTLHSPTLYLFGQGNGLYANRTGYDNQFFRAIKLLGLKDLTPYNFRHNYCTMCRESNIDINTCQFLMGHSDTRMVLEVYTHIDKTNKVMQAAIDNIKF